jgi:hypothetical protein
MKNGEDQQLLIIAKIAAAEKRGSSPVNRIVTVISEVRHIWMNVISAWVGKLKLNLVNGTAMKNGAGPLNWMNAVSVAEAPQVFLPVNRIAMGTMPEVLIRIIVVNVWKGIAGNYPVVRIVMEIGVVMR